MHVTEVFFFACNVIFKVCKEPWRGYSPLEALCFMVCGLRNAFIRKSVTKISLWTPSSSVLRYQYVPRNISTAQIFILWNFDRLEHVAVLVIFVLSLSPHDTFYPYTSLLMLPQPQSLFCKLLWKTQCSWQQPLSFLILLDVLWEMYFYMAETDCPLRPLWWRDRNKNDRRDTRDKNIYFHWVLEKIFITQKHSFFIWLWDRDQALYPRIYWLKDFKTVKCQIKKKKS